MVNPPPIFDPKHGTTTVALKYDKGIVVLADHRASAGTFIMSKEAKKVHRINRNSVMTISGLVGDAQWLVKVMKLQANLFELERGYPPSPNYLGNLLATILHSQFRTGFPYFAHLILAGVSKEEKRLYFLDNAGGIGDEDYSSSGSGSLFAYGVMEAMYKKNMPKEEAIKVGVKSILAALSRDAATGNGIDVMIVTEEGVQEFTPDETNALLSKYQEMK